MMSKLIKAGVVGAAGFAGVQACAILSKHPNFTSELIASDKLKGQKLSEVYPAFQNSSAGEMEFRGTDDPKIFELDVVFLAVPHKAAMDVAAKFVEAGVVVIDLSADFRIADPAVYEKWYGVAHTQLELLKNRAFGLPELFSKDLKAACEKRESGEPVIVACAGCYVTAITLAAKPFVESEFFDEKSVVVADAISGLTGAGKSPGERGLYAQAAQNFEAYGVTNHRHTPEIEQILGGQDVIFTPHLAPANRGILATVTMKISDSVIDLDESKLRCVYTDFYRDSHFVKVLPDGVAPKTKSVAGSNFANISVYLNAEKGYVIAVSAIDNLIKGAAGQAVQCANIVFDLPEGAGLDAISLPV